MRLRRRAGRLRIVTLITVGLGGYAQLAVCSSRPVAAQSSPPTVASGKRLCKPRLEWTSSSATRSDAQRKAIDGWASAAAVAHGESFTKWSIAGIARVGCTLSPDGHKCRAAASPCRDLSDPAATQPAARR